MGRPYLNRSIEQLEALARLKAQDDAQLSLIDAELEHRSTERAKKLRRSVRTALAAQRATKKASPPDPVSDPGTATATGWPDQRPKPPPGAQRPSRPQENRPEDILSAWIAQEALTPTAFARPEDLAKGFRDASVAMLDTALPWARGKATSKPHHRLYFHVVLGSIDMDVATTRLLRVFEDLRPESSRRQGSEAVLASVVVDAAGVPIEQDGCAVGSFGWALPVALKGELEALAQWPEREALLLKGLQERLTVRDASGKPMPLNRKVIDNAFAWLTAACDLSRDLVKPPRFALRAYVPFRVADPPDPLILNSFFIGDLVRARALVAQGKAPGVLGRYLGADPPGSRHDLLASTEALEDAVSPGRTPSARWPGAGRRSLILLQQAAVNVAATDVHVGGVLGVNGPPGTGKTTLLRDLVAAVLTERAKAMTAFDDPADAFNASGGRLKVDGAILKTHELDASLRGHELLVASSNNAAVENVSAELPTLEAIAADLPELRRLKTLSDALAKRETWGLVAAVLGNRANLSHFRESFWLDADVGLGAYLAAVDGVQADPIPRIVRAERPPTNRAQALANWRAARERFQTALAESEEELGRLERLRMRDRHVLALLKGALTRLNHIEVRPSWWARLFRLDRAKAWAREDRGLLAEHGPRLRAPDVRGLLDKSEHDALSAALSRALRPSQTTELRVGLRASVARLTDERERLGRRFLDEAFHASPHEERHRATPWLDEVLQARRDSVFVAAVQLHGAFVDAAARPLRQNLAILMRLFFRAPDPELKKALPDLWSSLFLLTPVVSTTFASVARMLDAMPPESLGWLVVDEAGQAPPQAAVGAMMRARRAIVVGDPLQVPPVVASAPSLTTAVCRSFGVDPLCFDAPDASVQTLADAASGWRAEFPTREGARSVGAPLLVHRRCSAPMFEISNAIAYSNLMVLAKAQGRSPIRDRLGPSRWIDVQDPTPEKWASSEGGQVMSLLHALDEAGVELDLFIVTPFVLVAEEMRRLLAQSPLGERLGKGRVGTIHTVQGREAEAVILILGAPGAAQTGARRWAGAQPNLLNVAVTRAKEALYVVGSRPAWKAAGVFGELDKRLG